MDANTKVESLIQHQRDQIEALESFLEYVDDRDSGTLVRNFVEHLEKNNGIKKADLLIAAWERIYAPYRWEE